MPYYTVLTTKLCEMHHFNIYLNLSEVLRVYAILYYAYVTLVSQRNKHGSMLRPKNKALTICHGDDGNSKIVVKVFYGKMYVYIFFVRIDSTQTVSLE